MIAKGKSRAAPAQLATYLMRVDDGEQRSRLLELRLRRPTVCAKAFLEWQHPASWTRGEKTLYHAQISPDPKYQMTPEQWKRAAEILGEELGLKDHPCAVVLHDAARQAPPPCRLVSGRTWKP